MLKPGHFFFIMIISLMMQVGRLELSWLMDGPYQSPHPDPYVASPPSFTPPMDPAHTDSTNVIGTWLLRAGGVAQWETA